jgi:hypothetical protein
MLSNNEQRFAVFHRLTVLAPAALSALLAAQVSLHRNGLFGKLRKGNVA